MLGVVSVCQQLLGLLTGRAHADQPQSDACSLACYSAVCVQDVLDLLKYLLIIAAQRGQPKAQAGTMLCNLQTSANFGDRPCRAQLASRCTPHGPSQNALLSVT